jgi:hypothetical protein
MTTRLVIGRHKILGVDNHKPIPIAQASQNSKKDWRAGVHINLKGVEIPTDWCAFPHAYLLWCGALHANMQGAIPYEPGLAPVG